ncbi:hypothetical protein RhiJN_11311 [Ceratobasidium sp. AG-Ba]|nr:hypothetical protein RhiJN_11311 [Ceratobasidium sp. AG-Ba]
MRIFSTSSVEMLNTLSSLESLNLYAPDYEVPLFGVSLQLPNLKHIGLHYAEPYHIEVVQQSNLLFGLEPFEIAFVKGDPDAAELWDEDWQSDTIRWICQCSLLRKLVIDAGVINFVLPTELAEMSAALPLTDVCLKGSALGSLSDASKFWPKVTRFYWDMSCQLADLPHLTGQPNLQHLGLKLVQSNTSGLHLYNGTPTLPALQTFELLGWPFTLGPDLSFIAQYLLSMWPNLREVIWSPPEIRRLDSAKLAKAMLNLKMLNDFIILWRDARRLKSGIINEYGKGVLDRMLG